ncbi:serine hydrolase [Candidatus Sumerlaeota bacterium]|nr:serine hydrolase [Candidatus Sumerlaeota bacterium]
MLLIALTGCRWLGWLPWVGDDAPDLPAHVALSREALKAIREDDDLSDLCARAAAQTALAHPEAGVAINDIAIAVIDLSRRRGPHLGHHRGFEGIEPGELIALPLGVEAMRQRVEGTVTEHQISTLLSQSLVHGDSPAINTLADLLTNTTSGPTLIGPGLEEFVQGRLLVDRSLQELGLYGICAAHRIGVPTGRELQLAERLTPSSNRMTAADTARLLFLLAAEQMINPHRSGQLLSLMERPLGESTDPILSRLPRDLPDRTLIWGLAGWSDGANHAAWLITFPNGHRIALAVFVEGGSGDAALVREAAEAMIRGL